jgi:hypothetical protein
VISIEIWWNIPPTELKLNLINRACKCDRIVIWEMANEQTNKNQQVELLVLYHKWDSKDDLVCRYDKLD